MAKKELRALKDINTHNAKCLATSAWSLKALKEGVLLDDPLLSFSGVPDGLARLGLHELAVLGLHALDVSLELNHRERHLLGHGIEQCIFLALVHVVTSLLVIQAGVLLVPVNDVSFLLVSEFVSHCTPLLLGRQAPLVVIFTTFLRLWNDSVL